MRKSQPDRSRFELALDASGMGVWEWRISDNRVEWSPDVDGIHPDDREALLAQLQSALTQRTVHLVTYRIIRTDGVIRWLEAHGRLIVDERGAPARILGVVSDITERRDAETVRVRSLASDVARAEAERQKERLSVIFESITDSFIVLDDDLRLAQANRAALRLARKPAAQLVGKKLTELPHTAGANVVKGLQRALHDQEPQVVEDYIPSMDRWFETSIFPLDHGLSVYSRDVTLRRRALEMTTRLARHDALRAEIGIALAEQQDMRTMLISCCAAMVRHLGVAFARCWTVDDEGTTLLLQASAGMYTHIDGAHRAVPVGKLQIGLIASEREPHLTNDVARDPRVGDPEWAKRENMVAFAGYPILVGDELVGVLAMFSRSSLPDDTLSALAGISHTMGLGITRRRAELELEALSRTPARTG